MNIDYNLDTAQDIRLMQVQQGLKFLLCAFLIALITSLLMLNLAHHSNTAMILLFIHSALAFWGYRKIDQALELGIFIKFGLFLAFLLTLSFAFIHPAILAVSYFYFADQLKYMANAAESRARTRKILRPALDAIPQTTTTSNLRAPVPPAEDLAVKNARVYLRIFAPAPEWQWLDPTESRLEIYLGETEAQKQAGPVCKAVHCGFLVFFVNDTGTTLSSILCPTLTRIGMSYNELYSIGIKNLETYVFKQHKSGIQILKSDNGQHYQLKLDGDFDASLLLLDTVWNNLELRMLTPNGVVAAIPERGTLLFCDAAQPHSIQSIASAARDIAATSNTKITDRLFIRRHHRWTEYASSQPLTPRQTLQQKFGALALPQLLQVQPHDKWLPADSHDIPIQVKETDPVTQKTTQSVAQIQHGGFIISFVKSDPAAKALRRVTDQELSQSGLSLNELATLANENLYDLGGAGRHDINLIIEPHGALFEVRLKDNNFTEASFLLLDTLWDNQVNALFSPPPLAVLPAQNKLAFCDATSTQGIEALKQYAHQHANPRDQASGFSAQLFIRINGRWQPYLSAAEYPAMNQTH